MIIKKFGNVTKINQGNHDIVTIRRTYNNFSDNSLHKIVLSIQYPSDEIFELVFVSYKFDGEPHVINVLPHANSKSKAPYIRTFKSTKISIQKELKGQKSVQRAMHNVTNNVGGLANVSSSCSLLKNSNQANYIRVKNKQSVADLLLSITQRIKNYKENNHKIFIRSYTLDDGSPKVIAFTEKQKIWQIFAVQIKIISNRCYL